ncbi:MAG: hypothetical protein LC667_17115 [Thioalkalivibrio sp.]|nr:hypothetical protein [Thioalkalivibrio sp.]
MTRSTDLVEIPAVGAEAPNGLLSAVEKENASRVVYMECPNLPERFLGRTVDTPDHEVGVQRTTGAIT